MATEYVQEFVDRGSDRIGIQVYPAKPDSPVVVVWPAMGVPARFYRPFATRLGEAGLSVVVTDLRGTGASTPRPSRRSRYGYTELTDDVAAVQEHLKPRLDGRRVVLLGHSLGGQVCALHLARTHGAGVDGLVLVAVGMPYYRVYPGTGLGVLGFSQTLGGISTLVGYWPGWGFGGRQSRGVIHDWAYTARHGRFRSMDGLDLETALGEVPTPVFAVTVDTDQFTPPPTLTHLTAKLSRATVARHHLGTTEAGSPIDHFKWVRASGDLPTRIAAFAQRP